jgi:hypothetical protein
MTRPVAKGWATVDLARAAGEMRGSVADGASFEDVARSEVLGATCRRAPGIDVDWIVLLEPDTEGRLAGFLARHGEGWAATWERSEDLVMDSSRRAVAGPFGPELLAADQSIGGPYLLLVVAATIDT